MDYKEKIIEMIREIESEKHLELAYGFVKPLYFEERGYNENEEHYGENQ